MSSGSSDKSASVGRPQAPEVIFAANWREILSQARLPAGARQGYLEGIEKFL
jgi:hypothetical protein